MNDIVKKYYHEGILKEACKLYGIQISSAELIKGTSNLIFNCGNKILRLSYSEIRNSHDIEVEVDWLNYLKSNKLSVVKVVKSINNRDIERIGLKDHFTVVCFNKIVGHKVHTYNWNKFHFQRLGKLVGLLHKVAQTYTEKDHLNYKDWDEIVEFEDYKFLPNKDYLNMHEKLVAEFNSYPKSKKNYGIIHYDIHNDNYFISKKKGKYYLSKKKKNIVLFDFEMICKSWYINDVSTVVYYAKHFPSVKNEKEFEKRFLKSFWNGYEQEFKIEDSEKKKIPKFLLFRDLLQLGFLNRIWDIKSLLPDQQRHIRFIEESISKRKVVLDE